jgi:hypothetical protein
MLFASFVSNDQRFFIPLWLQICSQNGSLSLLSRLSMPVIFILNYNKCFVDFATFIKIVTGPTRCATRESQRRRGAQVLRSRLVVESEVAREVELLFSCAEQNTKSKRSHGRVTKSTPKRPAPLGAGTSLGRLPRF